MADVGLVVGFVPDVVLLYLSLVTMSVSTSAFAMCPVGPGAAMAISKFWT
jgi:hypothetical protein